MKRRQALLSIALATAAALLSRPVLAAAPSDDLLSRLAVHAAGFEKWKTNASFAIDGTLQTIAADDATDSTKTMKARVLADGTHTHFEVVKYTENGENKTDEAREKATKREKERAEEEKAHKPKKNDLHMPFLKSEQPRYVFDEVETDKNDPTRVRITFVPKEKAADTIEGSAWVDTKSGTVVSAGFKLSQTPTFVDYVHITIEFGAPTDLGPAPSRVDVTGKGGVLFFSKRFRGEAKLSGYEIAK